MESGTGANETMGTQEIQGQGPRESFAHAIHLISRRNVWGVA